MLLAVDMGNTTVNIGLFEGDRLVGSWSLSTHAYATADEAHLALHALLAAHPGIACAGPVVPDDAVLSSVVPDLTDAWTVALSRICGRRPLVVGPGVKTGLKMSCNDPGEVGSDRIADLVAVKERHGFPVIVVDMGTTTNFEVIDREGAFLGGVVAPGLEIAARAMSREAARLPVVDLHVPKSVIGKNTREAMRSGMVLGEAARAAGIVEMIWRELGYETKVVATGEAAQAIAAVCTRISCVDADLTLHGLALIHARSRK